MYRSVDDVTNIIQDVCKINKVSSKDVLSKCRVRNLVYVRFMLSDILRNDFHLTLQRIANLYNTDHATVINHIKKSEMIKMYDDYNSAFFKTKDYVIYNNKRYYEYKNHLKLNYKFI